MSVAVSDPTADLWRSIVFVQINYPSGAAYGGTGVMVGPNDVLTSSHALYMPDQGGQASSVIVTPANWGQAPFGQVTSSSFHYYNDFDPSNTHMLLPGGSDGLGALTGSEHDLAIIDLDQAIGNQTGWMQLDPNFTSGNVNVTGFPAAYGWQMVNDYTTGSQGTESIINYSGIQLNPGNSGGPVWYQGADGQGHVAGVVSTPGWGASVKGVYNDLVNWINGNDYMIAGQSGSQPAPQPAPEPTPPADTSTQQPPATSTPTPPADTSTQTPPDTSAQTPTDTWTQTPADDGSKSHPAPAPQAPLTADLAPTLHDFNGDGNADLVLRNVASGAVEIRNVSGTSVSGSSGTNIGAGTDWSVAGTGDFNGDGRGDILWHHDGNGTVAIWTMNGAAALDSSAVGSAPASQHVAGVGDFNGDGRSDVLWRGDDGTVSTWQMNDHSIAGGGNVANVGNDWNVAAVADFSGDGKSDVLWRNDNGMVSMWLMDGTSHTSGGVMASASLDWHIAGVGDFNGDSHSDIVWQQDGGSVSIWLMNGDSVVGGWGTVTGTQSGWKLAGVGDFNSDHRSDLLWQDAGGAQKVELMDQLHTIAAGNLGSIGTDWVVS